MNGELILKKEETVARANIDLPEGIYRYRVSSVNKLGSAAPSPWENLTVQKKPVPETKEVLPPPIVSEPSYDRWQVLRRSAVLPGWGQHYRKDSNYRVFSYPILFSILVPLYYQNYRNNQKEENQYNSNLNMLLLTQNSTSDSVKVFGFLSYAQGAKARNELNQSYAVGNNLLLLMAAVYTFNLIDAGFFYDYSKPVAKSETPRLEFNITTKTFNRFSAETYYELSLRYSF